MGSIGVRRGSARWTGACVLGALVVVAAPGAVRAHLGSTKYIEVERVAGGARVEVAVDADDAGLALGLGLDPEQSALLGRTELLEAWLARGIVLSGAGGRCEGRAGRPEMRTRDGRRFAATAIEFACPAPVAGLVLRDDTVFADDPDHEAFVTVRSDAGAQVGVLRADARSIRLDDPPSAAGTARTFLIDGARHLVTGLDHLLFVLSLLLGGTLVARQRALREAAWLVTAFTAGHSASLVASALGWIALPSGPVEVCIAASIAVVAGLNIARREEPRQARPLLALGFGVVHGFGFASVLSDVGLPTAHRALALLSFNVGIEIAQLVFVAAVLPALAFAAARSSRRERSVVRGGSVAIAAVALFWVVERIAAV